MDEAALLDTMRPGSRNPHDDRLADDLGRFGLGLKTASFSQCRRLSVVSRKSGDLSAAIWDLDHVAASNRWEPAGRGCTTASISDHRKPARRR